MLSLKHAGTDVHREWLLVRDMPEDENGLTNAWPGISEEMYEETVLPLMRAWEKGEKLPEGHVPETFFFLWNDGTIVGQFRLRHVLCASLRTGAGHIGYYISPIYRGHGMASEGLRLLLKEARAIVPDEEIYLRVHRDNPASLRVMLKNGGRVAAEDEKCLYVRIPNPGKGRYPDRDEAEKILREAETCNPGPWGAHSRTAAHCAEKIALYAGLCPEKAYVLGLLHDIGRKFGKRHLGHVSDGYTYMTELGYPDCARICLTHSFIGRTIDGYVGRIDTTEEETGLIRQKLLEVTMDDYDRLIQLCDAISGPGQVLDIVERMSDVKRRYGAYDPVKWDSNLRLKAMFEERMHRDLYEAVDREHFRAGEST